MNRLRRVISGFMLACLLSLTVLPQSEASGGVACSGHFVNPITDVCWDCLFPLTIGDIPIFKGDHADGPNPSSPICVCQAPPPLFVKIGLSIGFWEPVRLADVTDHAWCFPNLGGITLPVGFGYASKASQNVDSHDLLTGYHVHWYIYPVMYWLELLTDFLCLEQASFDIGYVSELDPTWNDDYTGALISPEVLLFNNPIAQAACALDCVQATTTGMGNPALYWCAGCQGSMFPMTGNIAGEHGQPSGSTLAAERFAFKMHRELLAEGTSRPGGGLLQVSHADHGTSGSTASRSSTRPRACPTEHLACPAIGVSSIAWEVGKVIPVVGQDLGFLIWRKRNCCAGL